MNKLFSFNYYLLAPIDWKGVMFAVLIMGAMAVFLALMITLISKLFEVKEDTKIKEVSAHLSGANCGGCGLPGCTAFAKALVEGAAAIDDCNATSKTEKIEIANILGISFAGGDATVAVVACSGGVKCKDRYSYQGYGDCISQNIMSGGKKECSVGCMGMGSCTNACPSYAIEVVEGVAYTDIELCNSCGGCILACPKKLIKRVPASAKVYVACSSQCKGKDVTSVCSAGCIGCNLCVKACKHDALHLVNSVPVFDYAKCTGCKDCKTACPRKVIKDLSNDWRFLMKVRKSKSLPLQTGITAEKEQSKDNAKEQPKDVTKK